MGSGAAVRDRFDIWRVATTRGIAAFLVATSVGGALSGGLRVPDLGLKAGCQSGSG